MCRWELAYTVAMCVGCTAVRVVGPVVCTAAMVMEKLQAEAVPLFALSLLLRGDLAVFDAAMWGLCTMWVSSVAFRRMSGCVVLFVCVARVWCCARCKVGGGLCDMCCTPHVDAMEDGMLGCVQGLLHRCRSVKWCQCGCLQPWSAIGTATNHYQ